MGEINLVLTDVDGTLVWPGQDNPTPIVADAISKVQDAGVRLTAATGRPYEMARELFLELGFRGLCVFDAGASIRDVHTGEFAWKNWLEVERVKAIAGILLPFSEEIDFFPVYNQIPVAEASLDDIIAPAPYVFSFFNRGNKKTIIESLKIVPGISVHVGPGVKSRPDLLDIQITDIGSDKFHAVNALRRIVHSTKHQTLAIGDSTNDIPLFDNAGLKIAMGNAMDELKALADHVVGGVDDDGFAEAMQRFVLV